MEYENNDKKIESVFSSKIRAGKRRTYFFDVRATKANDYFLTITESRKRFDDNGYDRHKIFLYKEDFNKFLKALTESLDYVKTELMPDFDFDAFNHEFDPENPPVYPNPYPNTHPAAVPSNVVEAKPSALDANTMSAQTADATTSSASNVSSNIEETSPVSSSAPIVDASDEVHPSNGDNLSGEEVDKW